MTILDQTQAHLEKYVAFENPAHAFVLSLWVLHTHAFEAAYVTPYMYVSSVDSGAGKTTLMETVADVAANPTQSAAISAAYLFRTVDAGRGTPEWLEDEVVRRVPTLIIDEVDALYSSKNEELRAVLNSGYLYSGKTSKFVNGEPTDFVTFSPKLLGGIDNGQLPETVLDRCIRIRLRKMSGDKLAELNIARRNIKKLARDETLAELRASLADWATPDMVNKLGDIEPALIDGLSARQWDIAEPLVQIATVFGIQDKAREAILSIFAGEKTETDEVKVLTAAQAMFAEYAPNVDRLPTSALANATGWTPDRLSRLLAPLGVKAKVMKVHGKTVRGYYRAEFEAAWERYL